MKISEIFFLLLLFIAVFFVTALIILKINTLFIRKRIDHFTLGDHLTNDTSDFIGKLVKVVDPIGKISLPSEGWEESPLYIKFITAGWRGEDAPKLYFGVKTLLTFGFTGIGFLFIDKSLFAEKSSLAILCLLFFSAFGFYLPNMVLSKVIEYRQQELFENLPDAMDLLIVCMEAGLGFDQALSKVAKEISVKSKNLSQEFELVLMEVRSGFTRSQALKNLSLRTGVEEIDALAKMIIQSERFGTNVGDSLRVHSESARSTRTTKAQETAAKIALKLLFPLILCLMPALFIVMIGPSIIQLKDSFT